MGVVSVSLNHTWQNFLNPLLGPKFAKFSKINKQETNNDNKNRMPQLNLNVGYTVNKFYYEYVPNITWDILILNNDLLYT